MVCVCGSVTIGTFGCGCWAVGFFLVGITLSGVGSSTLSHSIGLVAIPCGDPEHEAHLEPLELIRSEL